MLRIFIVLLLFFSKLICLLIVALSEEDSKKLSMYMLVHISHSGETKRIVSAREYEVLRAFSLCPAAQQKRCSDSHPSLKY